MKIHRLFLALIVPTMLLILSSCQTKSEKSSEVLTLTVKTPPIGLGNIPDVGEVEVYDLLVAASEKFKTQYDKYKVEFEINRYNYLDEQEQLADKYGTDEAVDIFFSGSWNVPTYVARGWLVPLDSIIDDNLRADIDETIWSQNSIDGKVYVMPFHQLQNTMVVNKRMMESAGLEEYIPLKDTIAHWSTEEFDIILQALKEKLEGENKFAFIIYSANNQGDNHIMTLLRSYGGTLYDEDGNFAVNTAEGIQALKWIKDLDNRQIIPKGSENLSLQDCVNLFSNEQLAVCAGNLTNMWDFWSKGLDIFAANFPSLDGKGYCTSSSNGFCVFDNGDTNKIQVAKDFIRFIYTDAELMKYTLGTLPVNHSITEQYQDKIRMLQAYDENIPNTVDNIKNNLNWQGVRNVFYLNIRDLMLGKKTPEEVAIEIDKTCNLALEQGYAEFN